jgi:hypothetical protein
MLHCADCGVRLTGATGYYRHRDPCPPFVAAKPGLPSHPGRTHGKACRRELYEDVVGAVPSEATLSADLVARVVGEFTPSRQGPDRLTFARIARERAAVTTKYLLDRDTDALEAAMTRLDEEEREAREEKVEDGVPADEAVRYLKDLEGTGAAADGGKGRKMLAEALLEQIEVEASGRPENVEGGRGERGRASLAHLRFRPRFVLENVTLAARTWPVALRKAG